MEKQTQIVDASIIVKWFTEEEFTDKALELKESQISESVEIVVPEIIFSEVINALRYKKFDENALIEANKTLWNMGFKIERATEFLINKAIALAKKYDLTIYDALYIALAHLHGAPLITADSSLYKIPNVVPLENI